MSTIKTIPQYDPNWNENSQSMELHPSGDYVEFFDHEEAMKDLRDRVNLLQEAVNEAFGRLQEVAE